MTTEEIHEKIQDMTILPTQETICKIAGLMEAMNNNTIGLEREVAKLKEQSAPKRVVTVNHWNIWDTVQGAWWMPNACGYTDDRTRAGAYSYEEALKFLLKDNGIRNIPVLTMVPVPMV